MKTFSWPLRVYYEDTDSGGVVYHANYLHFMERARTEFLRSLGFEQDQLREEEHIIFAVRSAQIEYLKPARFNQSLMIGVEIVQIGSASMRFFQTVCDEKASGTPLVTGEFKIACIDSVTFKPKSLSKKIVDAFNYEC